MQGYPSLDMSAMCVQTLKFSNSCSTADISALQQFPRRFFGGFSEGRRIQQVQVLGFTVQGLGLKVYIGYGLQRLA